MKNLELTDLSPSSIQSVSHFYQFDSGLDQSSTLNSALLFQAPHPEKTAYAKQSASKASSFSTEASNIDDNNWVERASLFAQPLIAEHSLETGENMLDHAKAESLILQSIGASSMLQAASYLVYASQHLSKPREIIGKTFGEQMAGLVMETTKLIKIQWQTQQAQAAEQRLNEPALQTENVRKMLLAFSRDLRVMMLRLASRLQTLRYYAASKKPVLPSLATESLHVFAPLANRLGIWQIKWEMEDLAFRFLEPQTYREVAKLLDEKRIEREAYMQQLRNRFAQDLAQAGVTATVQGRPKHIYSIVKKMRGKALRFNQLYDLWALRVIVSSVKDCYSTLSWIHSRYKPLEQEFDDYIAKPKPNGYQSLHTVVFDEKNRAIEVQIRTQAMHDHAETGVAAHWAYKEAGSKGYAGVTASSDYDNKIAVLRQLLAWERDFSGDLHDKGLFEDRIYVLTPDAAIVELPQGATPVDFAYSVHTNIGHRCRGAKVDGVMTALNTPLQNGQTIEIITTREGGPSRDWLNAELGFLTSNRARSKVRAWFNAQITHETIAKGREAIEKLLQREGKTAIKLIDLASQLGFKSADALFEVVGKDEFSLRNIETHLRRTTESSEDKDDYLPHKKARAATHFQQQSKSPKSGVLVVGIDSLMTQLAKCCRPAPPDAIGGFVTRGKGVSVHRVDCSNFREMLARSNERSIEVTWGISSNSRANSQGKSASQRTALYPVDVIVTAQDRQGLLRDISEVFAREKTNVIGVQTQSVKGLAWMTFTLEVTDSSRLGKVLSQVACVKGVHKARRR